jgi:riboflavin kinase/FMN adenylyltransferase
MSEAIVQGVESYPASGRGCVLTIGNFDGVHRGHQRIVRTARELADAGGLKVVALTFEPPPDLVLSPDDKPRRITPHRARCRLLLHAGADAVVVARTDKALLAMQPQEFIDDVILRRFAPRHVVEGPNFFFGRGRSGNIETLRAAGREGRFEVHVVEPVVESIGGERQRVSSSLVRRLVGEGSVAEAARCLGRDFALYGPVVAGRGRGRVLEFPTVNLEAGEQVCPADGVYAGWAEVCGAGTAAAISVGRKPTFGENEPHAVEAFLLNAEGDYYDEYMVLSFRRLLRRQERFDTPEQLKAQIRKDVARVREICR